MMFFKTFSKPNFTEEKFEVPVPLANQAAIDAQQEKDDFLQQKLAEWSNKQFISTQNQMIKQFFINGLIPEIKIKLLLKKDLSAEATAKLACDIEKVQNSYNEKSSNTTAVAEEEVLAVRQPQQGQYQNFPARGGFNQNYRGNNSQRNYQRNGYNGNNGNWRNNKNFGDQTSNRGIYQNQRGQSGQSRGGYQNRQQSQNGSQGGSQNRGYGSNAQKSIICWYCHIPGHVQTKCTKRIRAGKPLVRNNNSVFLINGQGITPENGISEETIQKLTEAKIQGYCNEQDFQSRE